MGGQEPGLAINAARPSADGSFSLHGNGPRGKFATGLDR